VELHEVNKIGCAKAIDATGFNCDIEIDVTAPFVGRSKATKQSRFVSTDDGWRVVQ